METAKMEALKPVNSPESIDERIKALTPEEMEFIELLPKLSYEDKLELILFADSLMRKPNNEGARQ